VDPAERTLRARLAAHTQWAKEPDPTSRTAKARAAMNNKFVEQARELHPDASDEQIERAAEHLRKAHYARLGLASGKARRMKAESKPAA
jgi:hypothetical protein